MLDQHLRRWSNIKPTLVDCTMFDRKTSCKYIGSVRDPSSNQVIQSVSLQIQWQLLRAIPANTGHSHNAVSMLAHRLRRWPNIETALGKCPVFSGMAKRFELWWSY